MRKKRQILCCFDVNTEDDRNKLKIAILKRAQDLRDVGVEPGIGPLSKALLASFLAGKIDKEVLIRVQKKPSK